MVLSINSEREMNSSSKHSKLTHSIAYQTFAYNVQQSAGNIKKV